MATAHPTPNVRRLVHPCLEYWQVFFDNSIKGHDLGLIKIGQLIEPYLI